MYLSYLQLVNYKNFVANRFNFYEGANTIIGENDSGKSNAISALRILLDDSYYYNAKRLKESDFSYALDDWRGHWIIISAVFSDITSEDKQAEVCAEIVPEIENELFLKAYAKSGDKDIGIVTLFIRPQRSTRKKLSQAKDIKEFEDYRSKITLADYEFYFTSRSQTDFTSKETYKILVGDIEKGQYSDPENDDISILGCKLNMNDIQDHISVVFIDALRDVSNELHRPRNPIRRIVESIESQIDPKKIEIIKDKIENLNLAISDVDQIESIGKSINEKLLDMIGMVYSPEIALESQLNDEINALSRYLSIKPSDQNDINLLGLGHLNIIYMALKLVEYEFNRGRALVNIMIIEEPEAHIHTHIQKTLFDNLSITKDYTQVIMTTHSTHLSEVADIKRLNVLKVDHNLSEVMNPTFNLDTFGQKVIGLNKMLLSDCIERYLDVKRTVLLFSKGIILVEGDGEEILIPHMVKYALGVSLDELGIGLVNIGGTAFEYIASLFHDDRLHRNCAIIADMDKQIIDETNPYYKRKAESLGISRKKKLDKLFNDNSWVSIFYADNTFEIEFIKNDDNISFVNEVIDSYYVDSDTITHHKELLKGNIADKASSILTIANTIGKGWLATMLSDTLASSVDIPPYILSAIKFASKEVITLDIKLKMIRYSLGEYLEYDEENSDCIDFLCNLDRAKTVTDKESLISDFCEEFEDDIVSRFLLT